MKSAVFAGLVASFAIGCATSVDPGEGPTTKHDSGLGGGDTSVTEDTGNVSTNDTGNVSTDDTGNVSTNDTGNVSTDDTGSTSGDDSGFDFPEIGGGSDSSTGGDSPFGGTCSQDSDCGDPPNCCATTFGGICGTQQSTPFGNVCLPSGA